MTSKFCTSCGSPIAEGKRFCGKCGRPVAQAQTVVPPEDTTPTASSLTAQPCSQCGFVVPAGKRFCMKCGAGVSEGTPAQVANTGAPARAAFPPSSTLVAQAALHSEPDVPSKEPISQPAQAAIPASPQHPIETPFASIAPSVPATSAVLSPLQVASRDAHAVEASGKRSGKAWVLASTLIVVAAVGAGGTWLHFQHAKKAASASAGVPDKTAASSLPPSTTSTEAAAKPTAAAHAENTSPNSSPAPAAIASASASVEQPSALFRTSVPKPAPKMAVIQPSPKPSVQDVQEPTPPSLDLPTAPRAGDLHYAGPPVHFGGVIVFQHLPAGRLRFIFDHQAWQPLISREPDRSQTLTLRSLRQFDQMECDVHWELSP